MEKSFLQAMGGKGANQAVANNMLSPAYIYKVEEEIATSDMAVMQMEIPYATVKTVCELARKNHKTVLLNVAPAYHEVG